jgi:hypothetical protein
MRLRKQNGEPEALTGEAAVNFMIQAGQQGEGVRDG